MRGSQLPELKPLSKARIQRLFDDQGIEHSTDGEGEIVALFDEHPIWFLLSGDDGQLLNVMLQHRIEFGVSKLPAVRDKLDLWTHNQMFPRVGWQLSGAGFGVFGQVAHHYYLGATDAQLDFQLHLAIGTNLAFADFMDELLCSALAPQVDTSRAQSVTVRFWLIKTRSASTRRRARLRVLISTSRPAIAMSWGP